jgi:tetratricopeptide (TPR) repeat protein
MVVWHITTEVFRRFLEGRATKDEARQVVRHLIGDCAECVALTRKVVADFGTWFPRPGRTGRDESFERVFENAIGLVAPEKRRLAVERLRGWGLWASLEELQPEERTALALGDRRYHHWGFFRALLDASRSQSLSDPRGAVSIVELALRVSEILDPAAVGGEESATDLRAKGYGILGNARRLASDLPGAREAINEAWRLLEEGTGDPLERAQLLSFDASYIRMLGEFETAETTLEEALQIYTAAGDPHLQGRTLLQMGSAIGYADPARGIAYVRRALGLINISREPRLELCARHDLAHFLSDAGQPEEALAILDRARPLYKQFQDDWTQLRLHWLEGRIARALGYLEEAAQILRQVWRGFRGRALYYELVMVSIDLAETYVAQGHHATAARLIAEVHPILEAWGIHRKVLAAWLVLQQAVELRQAANLFSEIRRYLYRCWHTPTEFTREFPR